MKSPIESIFDNPVQDANQNNCRLELSSELLSRLLQQGLLCPADFRCLDSQSKNQVMDLCLQQSAQTLM